jgi:hypothetical protein
MDFKSIMKQENIILFLVFFVFLKYGLKEVKLLVFIVVSVVCVYYYRNSAIKSSKSDSKELKSEIDSLLGMIEKYDNNNLIEIVKQNISTFYDLFEKKNRRYLKNDIDSIYYLKDKILEYINSLNIQFDDNTIDYVLVNIKQILNKDIEKFRGSIKDNLYSRMFSKIQGYTR